MAEPIRLAAANEAEPQRLPRNIEAEAAFLGAILIDNRIIEDVSIKLQPDHFFEPLHGRIFDQILRLIDRNMLVTPVTLKPFFDADEAMQELGRLDRRTRFCPADL
jgi:replicative DNA helicase